MIGRRVAWAIRAAWCLGEVYRGDWSLMRDSQDPQNTAHERKSHEKFDLDC
jgi:hypothetical protein